MVEAPTNGIQTLPVDCQEQTPVSKDASDGQLPRCPELLSESFQLTPQTLDVTEQRTTKPLSDVLSHRMHARHSW